MEHVPPAPEGPPDVVVLIGDVHPRGMDDVERRANVRYVRETEFADALPGADVLFMWDFLSEALAGAWPRSGGPAWVHIASAGVDRLLFPGLVESDTVVTNSRGVFDEPIGPRGAGWMPDAATRERPDPSRCQVQESPSRCAA